MIGDKFCLLGKSPPGTELLESPHRHIHTPEQRKRGGGGGGGCHLADVIGPTCLEQREEEVFKHWLFVLKKKGDVGTPHYTHVINSGESDSCY